MGLSPESAGANYPYTPMLVGNAWVVFNCRTGLVAGWYGTRYHPRVWADVAGALGFIDILMSRTLPPPHIVGEIVWEEYPKREPAPTPVQKTWAPVRFANYEQRVKAVADAVSLPVPDTPLDKYKLLRAVEDLLAAR